jgi:hypothetical protein
MLLIVLFLFKTYSVSETDFVSIFGETYAVRP